MKKQRLAYMGLGAVIAVAAMIAATALNIGAQSTNPSHITIEGLTLVDSKGKRVLDVGINKFGGGQMTIYGTTNKPVLEIGNDVAVKDAGGQMIIHNLGDKPIVKIGGGRLGRMGGGNIEVNDLQGRLVVRAAAPYTRGLETSAIVGVYSPRAKGVIPQALMTVKEDEGFVGVGRFGGGDGKYEALMTIGTGGGMMGVVDRHSGKAATLGVIGGEPGYYPIDMGE